MKLRGRSVTILGLGRHGGGVAAARYCAGQGAAVTVTDLTEETSLADSLAALADVPIARFTLGQHRDEDFSTADAVVVNPAVKPGNRFVELARRCGAQITSETELFLDACPGTVIGVTGTVGKSTTAAMLAAMLQAADRRAWLGGNIGHSLLDDLPRMTPRDVVVLEISSFQLHWLNETARCPHAAIVTNCSPNHLDWHGTWRHYVSSKQRLLSHLPPEGFAVLNARDAEFAAWRSLARGECLPLWPLDKLPSLSVPGEHNRINAACAAAAAARLGVDEETISTALAEFTGLPHRLVLVAEIAGRRFYNDSKSTTPAATMAALATMDRPTWLLLGGADKQIDLTPLVREASQRAKGIALFGAVADQLHVALQQTTAAIPVYRTETLAAALRWCWNQSHPGDAVLLSPACASTDQFRDYTHRGEEFESLMRGLV